jgi:hypothetical protein
VSVGGDVCPLRELMRLFLALRRVLLNVSGCSVTVSCLLFLAPLAGHQPPFFPHGSFGPKTIYIKTYSFYSLLP